MRQLKVVKNIYSCLAISLVILGLILLFWPKPTLAHICKIVGIVLLICGMIKILGYFTKDTFQLAFQFDLGLGIISIIVGFVMMLRTEHFIWIVTSLLGIFVLVDAALKMQTAIEAKRFGIQKWWMILGISLIVMIVGISLITIPWKTEVLVTRLMGMTLGLHGVLNLWVVHNTVRIIRRKEI